MLDLMSSIVWDAFSVRRWVKGLKMWYYSAIISKLHLMPHFRSFAIGSVALLALTLPLATSAQSTAALQAKINALMAQIQALQAQLGAGGRNQHDYRASKRRRIERWFSIFMSLTHPHAISGQH